MFFRADKVSVLVVPAQTNQCLDQGWAINLAQGPFWESRV